MKKKNSSKELQSMGLYVDPVYIQIIHPHLNWLIDERKNIKEESTLIGINASIILFSCIYMEGLLGDILCLFANNSYIENSNNGKDENLVYIEKISSLDRYKQEFKKFGIAFNFLNSEKLENLKLIFDFRNLLAHGGRDSYFIMHTGNFTPENIKGGYYRKIDEFLIKRKVIKKNSLPQGNSFDIIFSNLVADWIYKKVDELCSETIKYIESQIELKNIRQKAHIKRIEHFFYKR